MIVDASAVVAVLFREPGFEVYAEFLATGTRGIQMSAVSYVEAAIKADRAGRSYPDALANLMMAERIEIAPVTPEQARLAREAHGRFGKGRHPARLNLGDCFAYALAKARNAPLLFKGDDFGKTDVRRAL